MVWYVLMVPLDGRIKQVNVLLDDFSDGGCALGVGEDGVLGDLEGLSVGVQKPLQGFSFDECGDGQALLLAALRVPPQHHVGRCAVLFGAFSNAGHTKNGTPLSTLWAVLSTPKEETGL